MDWRLRARSGSRAPLVYLALFDPPLEKKLLLVAASACSALLLALYVKPDLADRLILGTLQVDQAVETARPVRYLDFEHRKTDDGYEYRLPGEDWKPVMALMLEEIALKDKYVRYFQAKYGDTWQFVIAVNPI